MNRKLVRQLKLLQSIKPHREWSERTRDILLSQIKAQGAPQISLSPLAGVWAYMGDASAVAYRSTIGVLFARPAALVATLSFFVSGVVTAGILAQNSIPGEPLYTIKKTREQIQVALISTPDDRTQLELSLMDERLSELRSVAHKTMSDQVRQEAVHELVSSVNENLETVSKNLDTIKLIGEPKKIAKIAAQVNSRAGEYEKVLAGTTTPTRPDASRALQTIDQSKTRALEVIIDKKESAGISEQEIAGHLEEKIKTTEDRAEKMKVTMASLTIPQKDLEIKSKEALRSLDEAKGHLERGDFRNALTKITESQTLFQEVQIRLEDEKPKTDAKEAVPTQDPLKMKVSF